MDVLEAQPLLSANLPLNNYNVRLRRRTLFVGLMILLSTFTYIIFLIKIPGESSIEKYFENISNIQVKKITYIGWIDGPCEFTTDQSHKKLLRLDAKLLFWLNYNATSDVESTITNNQRNIIKFLNNNVIRNICLKLNNMTIYIDTVADSLLLGSIEVPNFVCIDLRDEVVTDLSIPLTINIQVKNVASILKQLINKQFEGLQIWSGVNLEISKYALFGNIPLGNIKLSKFYWDHFLNWNTTSYYIEYFFEELQNLVKNISFDSFYIEDYYNGFTTELNISLPKLTLDMNYVNIPDTIIIPPIEWSIKLPNCKGEPVIDLSSTNFVTDVITWKDFHELDYIKNTIQGKVLGPLPDELLYHSCSFDDENLITPITLILNTFFNSTQTLNFDIKGLKTLPVATSSLIPAEIIDELLHTLTIPICYNMTIQSQDIVEEVTIEKLNCRWSTNYLGEKRLRVVGKVHIMLNLSYYYPGDSSCVGIQKIRGITNLYHNGIHFLTIPIPSWTTCESEIFATPLSKIKVSFDIDDNNIEIVNNIELIKYLNEIMFIGETNVYISGIFDSITKSPLGDILLLGLSGHGLITVKK